jgi:hypothetical protein
MENQKIYSDWLSKHQEAQPILSWVASNLFYLAESFKDTGNEKMFEGLTYMGSKINEAQQLEEQCISEFLSEAVSSNFQTMAETMVGALNILAKKE